MSRETALLGVVALAMVFGVVHLVRVSQQQGRPSVGRQVVFGLSCGTIGAVVAAMPYADVVPDRFEGPASIVALTAILVFGAYRVRRAVAVRRPPAGDHRRGRGHQVGPVVPPADAGPAHQNV